MSALGCEHSAFGEREKRTSGRLLRSLHKGCPWDDCMLGKERVAIT